MRTNTCGTATCVVLQLKIVTKKLPIHNMVQITKKNFNKKAEQ